MTDIVTESTNLHEPRTQESASPFAHQRYSADPPCAPYELLTLPKQPAVGDEEWTGGMAEVGQSLRAAKVSAMYLVHGTFVGRSLFGLDRVVGLAAPLLAKRLRRIAKDSTDRFTGEAANFVESYAAAFAKEINHEPSHPISVSPFAWSGTNNHLGRADGAVRFLEQLFEDSPAAGSRIVVWTHSHGGNVMAIVSQLLGASLEDRKRFFAAADIYASAAPTDRGHWRRMRRLLLEEGSERLPEVTLDVVNFGTPIRYGWTTGGVGKLLHFVNHRPNPRVAEFRSTTPSSLRGLFGGSDGDFIQRWGICGSDVWPLPLSLPSFVAQWRLKKLLAAGMPWYQGLHRFTRGMRVAEQGTTLLVEYGARRRSFLESSFGHGMYTLSRWRLFHAQQMVARFYGA